MSRLPFGMSRPEGKVYARPMLAAPAFKDRELPVVLEALLVVAWADGVLGDGEEESVRSALGVLFGSSTTLSVANQKRPDPEETAEKLLLLDAPKQLWILRQCYSLARADGEVSGLEIEALKLLGKGLGLREDRWPELFSVFYDYDKLEASLLDVLAQTPSAPKSSLISVHLKRAK